ncbi:SDR family oxidoreductase [Companilactobacillus mishanensis]|uniref:SDR family oxidoreductase n=1 Tax=Companilactobacillus mishanensis TaxID=2486008 RepID=UPI0012954616|nr:SDR family oxidoreductase [Companilactobacillus mishanensis]MQS89795.1 SDR family oxidoreductase [Companilactobacillus mishanensis]
MEFIQNKVVVITGASSGIGKETATQLAAKGAKLVLGARRESALKDLSDSLKESYPELEIIYRSVDVTKNEEVKELIDAAQEKFGRIDVLFNNAGLMPISELRDGKVSEWEQMMSVNVMGALYGINAVLPTMEKQGSGQIITTDSVAGHFTGAGSAVYSGTKYAMRAIMEGLRVEEVGKNIKSTMISPGHAQTALAQTISDPETRAAVKATEMNEGLNVKDVASAVVYAINTEDTVAINEVILRSTNQRDY